MIQVIYPDPVQLRGVDRGDEDLQILADTPEIKGGESRKDNTCYGRPVLSIKLGSSLYECDD